jgi:hypothetical protein
MDDNGYDTNSEEMFKRLTEWAELTAEKTLSKELEHIPDVVGLMACLQYAARKVKLRQDLLTAEMAIQLFRNFINDLKLDNQAKA